MRVTIHIDQIDALKSVALKSSFEACGSLMLTDKGKLILQTDFVGESRKAVCSHSQFSYHTHPEAAYGGNRFGWPGKTDILTFCVAAVEGSPMLVHFVVAVEGVYVLIFRDVMPCTSCEKKAKILKVAQIIEDKFARSFSDPPSYCTEMNDSLLPVKISLIPTNATASKFTIVI